MSTTYQRRDPQLERDTNKFMMAGAGLLFCMAAIFPLYRWFEPTNRDEAREENLQSLAESGEHLYSLSCASCHGLNGEGGIGPALNSKQFLQSAGNEQIETFIAVGVPGTQMSGYSQDFAGPLTSEQIKGITVFLRTWEEDAPDVENWRDPLNTDADETASDE